MNTAIDPESRPPTPGRDVIDRAPELGDDDESVARAELGPCCAACVQGAWPDGVTLAGGDDGH